MSSTAITATRKRDLVIFLCLALLIGSAAFIGGFFAGKSEDLKPATSRESDGQDKSDNQFSKWRSKDSCPTYSTTDSCKKKVFVLASFDAFRADYTLRNLTPAIARLIECGVHSPYMRSVFPTKTFPNHYAIITGLYPESHGIVDNTMYDPTFNATFTLKNRAESTNPRWWGGEPLWVTTVKAKKKAATYFWPGSDVKIQGVRPTYYKHYDYRTPFETRVDTLISWLYLPEEDRPDFITMYLSEPDHAGHTFGPKSHQVDEALRRVDSMVDRLMQKMHDHNMVDCVNLVIVSDHGMIEVPKSKHIHLDDYIKLDPKKEYIRYGAIGQIRPYQSTDAKVQNIVDQLQCSKTKNTHMRTCKKSELPVRFHYRNNARISPIILELDKGYMLANPKDKKFEKGEHGYDNMDTSMRALFLGIGPDLKRKTKVEPFQNIELYNLICDIMEISPAATNGTMHSLNHLRFNPKPLGPLNVSTPLDYNGNEETLDTSGCKCKYSSQVNDRLKLFVQSSHKLKLINQHDAFKVGCSGCNAPNTIRLINEDFIVYFDTNLMMPIFATFTLSSSTPSVNMAESCWRYDVRLGDKSPTCSKYTQSSYSGIKAGMGSLFSPSFSSSQDSMNDAWTTSNSVPVYTNFSEVIIPKFYNFIKEKVKTVKNMNVVTGPIFDYGSEDQKSDPMKNEIPSHFFYVLTWCSITGTSLNLCSAENLEISAYILPHMPIIQHCQNVEEWATRNSARPRDVELLTGIQFYSKFPADVRAKLVVTLPEAEKWD